MPLVMPLCARLFIRAATSLAIAGLNNPSDSSTRGGRCDAHSYSLNRAGTSCAGVSPGWPSSSSSSSGGGGGGGGGGGSARARAHTHAHIPQRTPRSFPRRQSERKRSAARSTKVVARLSSKDWTLHSQRRSKLRPEAMLAPAGVGAELTLSVKYSRGCVDEWTHASELEQRRLRGAR